MPPRSNGWESLDVGALGDLDEKDFEQFCFDLVEYEAYERHNDPDVSGPTPAGKDGGRDVLLTVKGVPHVSRAEYQRLHHLKPLTHDAVARTAYSCKTGDDWLNLALRDAQKRGQRAIDVLREGGRFVVLINTPGKLDEKYRRAEIERTPKEHLVAALWERMKQADPAALDPVDRVEILDAHVLTTFLRARSPEGGALAKWMERFRLRPVLHGLDEWRELHREEREDLPFVDEERRTVILDAIVTFANERSVEADRRVSWLIGPPGVGKTRLVLEALQRDPSVSSRVRVAFSGDEASAELSHVLDRYPAVLLVVDDCPAEVARELARSFRVGTRGRDRCHLLLVTPAAISERERTDITIRWELERLGDEAVRRLARNALRGDADVEPATIEQIVRFSEGFPWFVALLTRESVDEGRAPRDMREAVDWALASRGEAAGQALRDLRRSRMRAMLATLLTRGVDWQTLTVPQQDAVARAVGAARWDDIVATANDCVRRGVLRRRLHFQYVTPQVLAREIVTTLFDPGGGDDPRGRRIVLHGGEFLEGFFGELKRLDLRADIARSLARTALDRLAGLGRDWDGLRGSQLLGDPLLFVAEHLPAEAARALRGAIEATTVEELRARGDVRRPVMFALSELVSRRDAFEDAEASLFRLALGENEAYANNATEVWAQLFAPVLHMTHRSPQQRAAFLETRLAAEDPTERRLALKGAQAMLVTSQLRSAPRDLDGPWSRPTENEAQEIRKKGWSMLLERLDDDDADVVTDAVDIVCAELVVAMWVGLGDHILPSLTARAPRLGEKHRRALGEVLQRMRTHGSDDPIVETAAFRDLERALTPTTFSQRLRLHVGTWAADLHESVDALDDEVAREALSDVAVLVAELDWLFSSDAVRAASFARALGRCDQDVSLLSVLRARCVSADALAGARGFLPRYLAGVQDAGRQALVDAELRSLRGSAVGNLVLAQVTVLTTATPERLDWIEVAVHEEPAPQDVLVTIGHHGRWLREISDDRVRTLLALLLERDRIEGATAVLRIVQDRISRDGAHAALFRDAVMRALERTAQEPVSPVAAHVWAVCAMAMIDLGEVGPVTDLTVCALGRPSGSLRDGWRVLRHAYARDVDATWDAVARGVDRRDPTGGHLLLAFRFHRETFVWPTDRVLAWVGHDARRGRAAVQLVQPDEETLPPVLRALVERFGTDSSVADEVMARITSTNGMVASLVEHDRQRLEAARRWLDDEGPVVRAFARRLADSLEASLEVHAAEEDEERRRWGT